MPEKSTPHKNSLSIRLSEAAVFLRTDASNGRRQNVDASRTSILRGLLTLELVKPTKITSIDIELQATTSTAWPEGIGARRIEVTEQHRVFHASTIYFCAGKIQSRRTASIGPGVTSNEDLEEHDWDDPLSYTPRGNEEVVPANGNDHGGTSGTTQGLQDPPPTHYPYRTNRSITPPPGNRNQRRVSVDSSNFQRIPLSHHEEYDAAPIPPYSPQAAFSPTTLSIPGPSSSSHLSNFDGSPTAAAQNLEEFRNSLHSSLSNFRSNSSSPSPHTRSHPERSLSRAPSMDDVPEHELGPSNPHQAYTLSPPPTAGENGIQGRGRKGSRFGFANVSNVLINVVRSSSQTSPKMQHSRERDRSQEVSNGNRGRTMERAVDGNERMPGHVSPSTSATRSRARESRERVLSIGRIFGKAADEKAKDATNSWKEFKKGTYTYPISFPIPGNAPPTMQCDYGSVTWKLRATAHRPGTFQTKLSAGREVIMIACPTEEDTEDTENIVVERHWDQQLQYLISISGRSFYIGGTVPVTFTLMPLAKVKIHRISVFIEERVDYYTHMRRIARSDPVTRVDLLSVKGEGKGADPILPLESDEVDAFRKSPLFAIFDPEDDISEVASSLMGPGPWTFHQNLRLPDSCGAMRFTNKNRRSNIVITHLLKCVLRVERGDDVHMDGKTGKKKLFDIVVQTPVQILSCRCNPEWTSLPRYSEVLDDSTTIIPNCPCQVQRMMRAEQSEFHSGFRYHLPAALERMASRQSSDSNASTAETSPVNPLIMRTLRHRSSTEALLDTNSQFERLISGQETEMGEAPPAYVLSQGPVVHVA